jgi:hypothetical protein
VGTLSSGRGVGGGRFQVMHLYPDCGKFTDHNAGNMKNYEGFEQGGTGLHCSNLGLSCGEMQGDLGTGFSTPRT